VLVVSHGGCLHTIFCVMDDIPLANMQNDSIIPNAKAVELNLEKFLAKLPLEG
jgi:broad specificity phosphatase PhoE